MADLGMNSLNGFNVYLLFALLRPKAASHLNITFFIG